jgi:hypothetical protein
MDIDLYLENKKNLYTGISLQNSEYQFLLKSQFPKSYLDFVKKEEWYLKIARGMPELRVSSK